MPLLRSEIVKILYEALPDKDSKVVTSAEVVDIKTSGSEVHVHLRDGTIQTGSIVVGADGVHSKTRTIMNEGGESPMSTTFHGLLGRAPNSAVGLGENVFFESRGGLAAVQCSAVKDTVFFATLRPVPGTPLRDRHRYTREEMEEHAASLGDVWVAPGLQFRDIWAAADKERTRMLNQEEGFLEGKWYHGRTVLLGDSVHKTTSINGLGLTNGLHSAAALANELQRLVTSSDLGDASVLRAFERYQHEREGETKTVFIHGWNMIREVTKTSWVSRFWDNYILPWVDSESALRGLVVSLMLIRHGQALSFLPFTDRQAWVPWLKHPAVSSKKKSI